MNCHMCGRDMSEQEITSESPYRYSLSGLKNVFLSGITLFKCQDCGESYPVIPKIAELHNVIAKTLIAKEELLEGPEVRFLRKNAGFSGVKFAALLKIGPSHLSNVEHERDKLSPTADKMARLIAEAVSIDKNYRDMLLEVAEGLKNEIKAKQTDKKLFGHDGNTWQQLDLVA